MSLEGPLVIQATSLAELEREAVDNGADGREYMHNAANEITQVILAETSPKLAHIFCGKGNNGGDGMRVASLFLDKGIRVHLYQSAKVKSLSPLCKEMREEFEAKGGHVLTSFPKEMDEGIIIDALFGSGFSGEIPAEIQVAIHTINTSKLTTVSVDIPSGLNGDDGQCHHAVKADITVTLQLPKMGFFIRNGWNYVGKLFTCPFGLEEKYIKKLTSEFALVNHDILQKLLPAYKRNQHKYSAGYLLAVAGSFGMEGAAALLSDAAMRTSCGIVRLFSETKIALPKEVVSAKLTSDDISPILEEAKRAGALAIGPGIGKKESVKFFTQQLLSKIQLPSVIDADALYDLVEIPPGSILTPHHGEMEQLLCEKGISKNVEIFHQRCSQFSIKHNCTLILKGAPTFIFHPGEKTLIVTRGDPGMATAGSGDVLTGIIGSLLASRLHPRDAALLGTSLHGIAGELAASELGFRSMIASDIIEKLPCAIKSIEK